MNSVDITIIILLLGLGIVGWRSGVIKIALTLIGGVVGLVLAGRLWENVAQLLPIANESFAGIAAFIVILGAVSLLAWLVGRILKMFLRLLLLGWIDGLAGAAIGLLLGGVVATAIVSAAGIVPSDSVRNAVDESKLAEPLIENMGFVYTLLPSEFDQVKNLVGQSRNLIKSSASFLEINSHLETLISQDSESLEHIAGLDELITQARTLTAGKSDLVVGFKGLSSNYGAPIKAIFVSSGGAMLGPLTSSILPSGLAVLAVRGTEASQNYTLFYYIDADNTGSCNISDPKGAAAVTAGVSELIITHSSSDDSVSCTKF